MSLVEANGKMLTLTTFRSRSEKLKPAKEEEAEPEDGARRDAGQYGQRGAG